MAMSHWCTQCSYVTSESCLQSEERGSSVKITWLEGRVWGHENGAGEVLGQGYPLGLGFPTPAEEVSVEKTFYTYTCT